MASLSSASTRSRLDWPGIATCRKSRLPQQQSLSQTTQPARPPPTHPPTHPALPPTLSPSPPRTHPAAHLRGPSRLARLFATVAICSVARLKRSGHPDCPRAGLDTSVAMGCSIFSCATSHAPPLAAPLAAPHAAPRTPQRTRGVSCTIRGCLHQPRRSRADLNPTPTASPLMRSPMAHARRHMAVAAWMSYVSPHIHPSPKHLPAAVQWPL